MLQTMVMLHMHVLHVMECTVAVYHCQPATWNVLASELKNCSRLLSELY